MKEDEFKRRYAQLEDRIRASDELKRKTKEALGVLEGPSATLDKARTTPSISHAHSRFLKRPSGTGSTAPSTRRVAAAACVVIIVGAGVLCGINTLPDLRSGLAGNSFTLTAYADDATPNTPPNAEILLESFHPSRTSAGYLYDTSSGTIDHDVVSVSRYYAFDISTTGRNITSVTYTLEGDGVSYGSWKGEPGYEGVVEQESSKSFTIPYNEQQPVLREIGLNYILDASEKAEFDQAYDRGDIDGMDALLARCDAKRLADATLTATATYLDGSSQTKTYQLEPSLIDRRQTLD